MCGFVCCCFFFYCPVFKAESGVWVSLVDFSTDPLFAEFTILVDSFRRSREWIQALKMRCFCKLLCISYRNHITNAEVKARIGNAIRPNVDLLTSVKRLKLKWYGRVTQSSGLAKTVLQGTVQGGRRRGTQRKRWEDNIKQWTGLPWNIMLRKAENREEWRKLVVKSAVVPQRSARLWDR